METFFRSDDDGYVIQLNEEELDEISASKKDIENGSFIEYKLLKKEVKIWLKER